MVAEFDRQYMLLRLDDYRAGVAQLEADIKKMKAQLAVVMDSQHQKERAAKAALDKAVLDLKTIEVRSAIESESFKLAADEAKAKYDQAVQETKLVAASQQAQIRAAEIDFQQGKIELQRSENNAERMVLKAPLDGMVVMQSLFRGGDMGQIRQGDQVRSGMFFMSIVDPTSMVLNAKVNQVDSEQLRLGQKAEVLIRRLPGDRSGRHRGRNRSDDQHRRLACQLCPGHSRSSEAR